MATQRFRTLNYEPLDKMFTDASCTVQSIDLPDIKRSNVVSISQSQDPGPLYFHTSERQEIVKFSITYIPHDNVAGKKLLPFVKTAVQDVLKKDYTPEVAIVRLVRNGTKTESETRINDCVITGGEILVDEGDYIYIRFTLQGLLHSAY